ncbi:hypothetical protein FHS55_002641 [Angulomicrobium tetraedrale]|uniref:Portal protein n=1 Tax=Ancylobacter tetraedralis TaxID=217068 RepID=A0A839ZBF4_9HYPH|nr:hypothetical protein [Ancylobacter tetraedralis]MBB3772032.1 hypothetical protein [Ancylobacter tetraedralis]
MDERQEQAAPADEQYAPATGESKAWLEMIAEAERKFRPYQETCDAIDKLYADLKKLAGDSRDREFQMFWANIQVLAPAIYSRPPVPVVVPRFKDGNPTYRVASELLERAAVTAFDLDDINSTMLLARDDLAVTGRGCLWVRYESDDDGERICIEHVDRKDFLSEPARKWKETGWSARRSWLGPAEMKGRFEKTSGDAYLDAAPFVRRPDAERGGATLQPKAPVWELWSKTESKVVWVTEGVEVTLDEGEPHLKLDGFFPCPRPAYATVQRGSLIPVPDVLFYKDQLEEINQCTRRIHALAEAIKFRVFYPAGGEIGSAVEAALNDADDGSVAIPVANWAAMGTGGGDKIIVLPLEKVAQTIQGLLELRRAMIDDVYQIVGLSDIMRGSTDPNETKGAQQLKAQFGSVRIRDKQAELVRVARDAARIGAEIMAENFKAATLLDMSQMDIPTDRAIADQVKGIETKAQEIAAQIERAKVSPQMAAVAQQNPQAVEQLQQQAQQQIQAGAQQVAKLKATPTIEQVTRLLRDQRMRPFVLDIETDSTIQPDEQAEKAARSEFVTALGGLLAQFGPVVMQYPALMGMVGEVIKFALAPFRAGRELEGKIAEAIDQMASQASAAKPNPDAEKAKADAERQRADQEMKAQELQAKMQMEARRLDADMQMKAADAQRAQQESDAKLAQIGAQMQRDDQKGAMEMRKLELEIAARQQDMVMRQEMAREDAALRRQSAAAAAETTKTITE